MKQARTIIEQEGTGARLEGSTHGDLSDSLFWIILERKMKQGETTISKENKVSEDHKSETDNKKSGRINAWRPQRPETTASSFLVLIGRER